MNQTELELVIDNTHALIDLSHQLLRVSETGPSADIIREQLSILYTQLNSLEPATEEVVDTRVRLSSLSL